MERGGSVGGGGGGEREDEIITFALMPAGNTQKGVREIM
jgi:hypothetical protein